MQLFGCRHSWGKLEGSVQYCNKCGIARPLPCNHKWEIIKQGTTTCFGATNGVLYIIQCKHCGEISKRIISID
jgi:uncharacterized Zn finger protein